MAVGRLVVVIVVVIMKVVVVVVERLVLVVVVVDVNKVLEGVEVYTSTFCCTILLKRNSLYTS